ncbi:MAG: hypothetical protein D6715_07660 [Calditrichaeota bacterium]|nr:MAG: hypothetical protein D6715_07660 [Calditrichota bacterium]
MIARWQAILMGVAFLRVAMLPAATPLRQPPTNEALFIQALVKPALQAIHSTIPRPGPLLIQARAQDPLSQWLVRQLVDSTLAEGWQVFLTPDSLNSRWYRVQLSQARGQLQYRTVGRRLLLFASKTQRRLDAQLHLQLVAPDGKVLYSNTLTRTLADTIPHGRRHDLENRELPFTKGVSNSNGTARRWVEPLLVTASTATAVYLFFVLRND